MYRYSDRFFLLQRLVFLDRFCIIGILGNPSGIPALVNKSYSFTENTVCMIGLQSIVTQVKILCMNKCILWLAFCICTCICISVCYICICVVAHVKRFLPVQANVWTIPGFNVAAVSILVTYPDFNTLFQFSNFSRFQYFVSILVTYPDFIILSQFSNLFRF